MSGPVAENLTRTLNSRQGNVDAVELVRLRGIQIGDSRLRPIGLRPTARRQVRVRATDQIRIGLYAIHPSRHDRGIDQALLGWLTGHVLNLESEHRRPVGGVEPGHILEEIVLTGAVGVACGA